MSNKTNCVVVAISILCVYLCEIGTKVAKVEVLVSHRVSDVPATWIGSIEGTCVLSQPVNVSDALGLISVSLYRDTL